MIERRTMLGKDAIYLTSAGKPLDEVIAETGQMDMFAADACDIGGYCAA
jgi:hypothetical protein